jgi:hypothetical protein
MSASNLIKRGALPGAAAGLVGGLAWGAAMSQLQAFDAVAALVHSNSAVTGLIVHLVIAGIAGAGFGLLVFRQGPGAGEMLFWGLTYATVWWFLGEMTLGPLIRTGGVAWNVASAQAAFPSLMGHLLYGAVTAVTYAAISARASGARPRVGAGPLFTGMLAGLAGAWFLGRLLAWQAPWLGAAGLGHLTPHTMGPYVPLTGIAGGLFFALLYPELRDGTGPALIRGTMFGFFCWVVGALTVIPEIDGMGAAWSLDAARAHFPTLPAFLLFGAFVAVAYGWIAAAGRLFLTDDVGASDEEGVGTRSLRAVGRGAVAGFIGGLVFTIIMVRIGFLPTVARIVGASSPWSGFLVHLVIANMIGASFGLVFSGRSVDIGSALGWGVSYGFFWWILGPLTLLPVLLGTAPRWTPDVAGALFPSLIGHLAYGAALGITFYHLEARYNPWWIPHTEMEAARSASRREQVLTSAPALWALVVVIALTLPVVLSCGMPPATGGYSMAAPGGGYGVDTELGSPRLGDATTQRRTVASEAPAGQAQKCATPAEK